MAHGRPPVEALALASQSISASGTWRLVPLDATIPSSRQLFAQTRHSRLSRFRLSNQYPREALLTIIGRSTRQRLQWHDDLPSRQCQNALGFRPMSRPQTLAPFSSAHRPCSTCSGSDHIWHMACHCLSLRPSFLIGNLRHSIASSTTTLARQALLLSLFDTIEETTSETLSKM